MFVVFHFLPEITQILIQKVTKIDSKLRQKPSKNLFRMQYAFLIDFGIILAPKMKAKGIQNGTRTPKKSSRGLLRVAQASPSCPPSPSGHHIVHFLATFSLILIKINKKQQKHIHTLRFLEIKDSTNSINQCMFLDSTFLFVSRNGYMLLSKMLQNRINSSKPPMHFDYPPTHVPWVTAFRVPSRNRP